MYYVTLEEIEEFQPVPAKQTSRYHFNAEGRAFARDYAFEKYEDALRLLIRQIESEIGYARRCIKDWQSILRDNRGSIDTGYTGAVRDAKKAKTEYLLRTGQRLAKLQDQLHFMESV